jgi:NADPH2:quinone reductase
MRAAWYESQGPARTVLRVGELPTSEPGRGEVRIAVRCSGINVGDVKKRQGWLGFGMAFPRVVPHSDGAGVIDAVGEGVDPRRVGERVWCHGAQSYRPSGTAADHVVVPAEQALPLPDGVSFERGACLGIPALTAHRAVFGDGPVPGRTVLVAGAAGAVGSAAVELAAWAGARVLATVRSPADAEHARRRGADEVFVLGDGDLAGEIRASAPAGVDRIVEVALDANAELDAAVAAPSAVIAAYASHETAPRLPFWPLLFNNVTLRLLGSDDFPADARRQAVADIGRALADGRLRPRIAARLPLERIADAHELVERRSRPGRVLLTVG